MEMVDLEFLEHAIHLEDMAVMQHKLGMFSHAADNFKKLAEFIKGSCSESEMVRVEELLGLALTSFKKFSEAKEIYTRTYQWKI